jgi:hypothetical protein
MHEKMQKDPVFKQHSVQMRTQESFKEGGFLIQVWDFYHSTIVNLFSTATN